MKKFTLWAAPLGGVLCLIAAAIIIYRTSGSDVKKIYGFLDRYDDK